MIPSWGRGQGRAGQAVGCSGTRQGDSRAVPKVPMNIRQHFGLGAPSKAAPPHQNFWPKLEVAPAGKGLGLVAVAGVKPELL